MRAQSESCDCQGRRVQNEDQEHNLLHCGPPPCLSSHPVYSDCNHCQKPLFPSPCLCTHKITDSLKLARSPKNFTCIYLFVPTMRILAEVQSRCVWNIDVTIATHCNNTSILYAAIHITYAMSLCVLIYHNIMWYICVHSNVSYVRISLQGIRNTGTAQWEATVESDFLQNKDVGIHGIS